MSNSTKQAPEGDAMDLQTFVTESLVQIFKGIERALEKNVYVLEMGSNREVEFDVAIRVTQAAGKKGGAGIFVGGFGIGGQASSEGSSSSVSRIKFSVPVVFPGKP